MSTLSFEAIGARPDRMALTPTLHLVVAISVAEDLEVQSILLRCQVRIEPDRRRYDAEDQHRLHDLFGEPERWGATLQAFPLAHVTLPVGGFTSDREIELPLELSYDLEVAAGKYLHALRDGEVPLLLLFSGTMFLRHGTGVRIEQIPWDREARYRLPVATWQELMDLHYPGTGWLRLRRETIDALQAYKTRHGLPTWDDTLTALVTERESRT
jgi:hypothetical protein